MIYTLPQLIEYSALKYPDKDAFRCLDEGISYAQLVVKAKKLSTVLLSCGIQKGDRVGIYMNRCLETCIAVYGILMSGGAYVPINPFTPISSTLFILEDCGIAHIVTSPSQGNKIKVIHKEARFVRKFIGISNDELGDKGMAWNEVFSKSLSDYYPPNILEQDLAFILYTSGSTGTPKGIMHTHYSGLSLAKIAAKLYNFNENDRIGTFAPLYFDPSTFGYLASPLVGSTAIIIPDAYLKLPVSLSELVSREKITIWYSVPLMLINIMINGEIGRFDFKALRWVLFAGEVFITKHLRKLMLLWPHAQFSNLYGPAEVILCTYYHLEAPPANDDPISIGTVWDNTEYKILDAADNEVAKGEPGELVVRTATLMHGYWKNKQLTEKAFFRLEIAEGYDHIFYRTGDLVQENASNELMFLGRNDRQIKLRGYRLELDGIELSILKHPAVEEAAVIVLELEEGEQELAGAVRLIRGSTLNEEELVAFCMKNLPAYAIPKSLVIMDEFPRTGSGKIDRNKIINMISTGQV